MSRRRFVYALEALLKKRTWDADGLRQELANTRQALAVLEREAAELKAQLADANARLRRLQSGAETFDLVRQRIVLDYRAGLESSWTGKQAEIAKAEALCGAVAEQLARERRAVKGYEEHRDVLKKAHEHEARVAEAHESDDRWLARAAFEGAQE